MVVLIAAHRPHKPEDLVRFQTMLPLDLLDWITITYYERCKNYRPFKICL